jgi:signal peptidase I
MYKRLLVIILLISGFALAARAQNPVLNNRDTKRDTINRHRDSVTSKPFVPKIKHDEQKYHPDSLHSPHKAVIRSLIIPGWGQVYNHHWWKVPLIYTALGLLGDAYVFNEGYYQQFLALAKSREHGTAIAPGTKYYNDYILYANVPDQTIYDANDSYRRDRDLSIMGFVAFWGIQMVDAYIDAKFQHSYTMDTDFSLRIDPTILNQQNMLAQGFNGPIVPGLKLSLTF